MSKLTSDEKKAVIDEALSWRGTPFHHAGRIKGVGVDCAMFPLEVFSRVGLIPPLDNVASYPADWHLHRDEERYLWTVQGYADECPPDEADFALFRFGRCFSHGAIVLGWPRLIHAYVKQGVIEGQADQAPLADRDFKTFMLRR